MPRPQHFGADNPFNRSASNIKSASGDRGRVLPLATAYFGR